MRIVSTAARIAPVANAMPGGEREVRPDAELLARARDGDAAAFRAIFDRHGAGVRRFLCDLLRDRESADEATQETFVRAHTRLHTLREGEKLQPWLFGIARHVFHEARRVRRHREPLPSLQPIDPGPTPEAVLLGREADRALADALATLSEERRAALLLRIDHGLDYEEIREVMGWTLPKVKNEIHRARLELREKLGEYIGGRS
jgi:RNA polymerase sigma-70 factor (ECF subfamily)